MKKVNLEMIKRIGELLNEDLSIEQTFSIVTSLYHYDLSTYLSQIQEGKKIEEVIASLYNATLFQEMVIFYSEHYVIGDAILKSIELLEILRDFKKRMINILSYPCLLLLAIFIFSLFAIIYIRPRFNAFYLSFHIELSLLHQILIYCLFYFPAVLILMILILVILVFYVIYAFKCYDLDKINELLRFPIPSIFIQNYISMKFDLYYKEFMKSEVSFYEIILFLKDKIKDEIIGMISYHLQASLEKGIPLSDIFMNSIYFDDQFKTIYQLSLNYDQKAHLFETYFNMKLNYIEGLLNRLKNIITPVVYLMVGSYIVGIYSLMILPMTNMISMIG